MIQLIYLPASYSFKRVISYSCMRSELSYIETYAAAYIKQPREPLFPLLTSLLGQLALGSFPLAPFSLQRQTKEGEKAGELL